MREILGKIQGDKKIWLISCVLAIISILAVYSSVSALAFNKSNGLPERFIFLIGTKSLSLNTGHKISLCNFVSLHLGDLFLRVFTLIPVRSDNSE